MCMFCTENKVNVQSIKCADEKRYRKEQLEFHFEVLAHD